MNVLSGIIVGERVECTIAVLRCAARTARCECDDEVEL